MFDDLKDTVEERKGIVNVLVATEQLESFAFKYAMAHFTENQGGIFSEENFGMSIYSVAISAWSILVVLLIVKIEERRNVYFDGRELHRTTLEEGHMTDNRSRFHKPH